MEKEFKGKIDCLGENNITFSVPIKKELDNSKTVTYKLKFINSYRSMSDSLSNLVDILSEINKKEGKTCMERNNTKSKFIEFKINRLHYKCKKCNGKSCKSINELIKKFSNTYQFCNGDLNKFSIIKKRHLSL